MVTKHNENIITTSIIEEMKGKYLAERLLRSWNEDFVDEDTSEVVSITRNELIFERGTLLGSHELSEINFLLQSNDINKVIVSNQRRGCQIVKNFMNVWVASVEINNKPKNIYLYSNCISLAKEIIEDFVSQQYQGVFRIKSIKETRFSHLITEDTNEDDFDDRDENYYKIEVEVTSHDLEKYTQSFILKSTDAEKAKQNIILYLTKKRHSDGNTSAFEVTIISAKTITCEDVVDHNFSMEYLNQKEE